MKMEYVTFQTTDLEGTIAFWERVFGFRVVRRFSPRPRVEIAFLSDGSGFQVEFIQGGDSPAFSGSGMSLGFHVADIDQAAADLRAKGVPILSGPSKLPNGVGMLRARDPNGIELGFVQEGRA